MTKEHEQRSENAVLSCMPIDITVHSHTHTQNINTNPVQLSLCKAG